MAKFSLTLDQIKIDTSAIETKALMPTLEKAMKEILTAHSLNYQSKRTPDGSAQKENSEPYRSYKSGVKRRTRGPNKGAGGIRVGEKLQRGEVPLYLTGEMIASRNVQQERDSVVSRFEGGSGKNALKAKALTGLGYGLHYFSPANIELVKTLVADFLARAVPITVVKK